MYCKVNVKVFFGLQLHDLQPKRKSSLSWIITQELCLYFPWSLNRLYKFVYFLIQQIPKRFTLHLNRFQSLVWEYRNFDIYICNSKISSKCKGTWCFTSENLPFDRKFWSKKLGKFLKPWRNPWISNLTPCFVCQKSIQNNIWTV